MTISNLLSGLLGALLVLLIQGIWSRFMVWWDARTIVKELTGKSTKDDYCRTEKSIAEKVNLSPKRVRECCFSDKRLTLQELAMDWDKYEFKCYLQEGDQ